MVVLFWCLLLAVAAFAGISFVRSRGLERERQREELERVKQTAEEDVTLFGEELSELDLVTATAELDAAGRQDYQRALDSYETAKQILDAVSKPEDIKHVTEALEDGRYAASCVQARVEGRELPTRRPPCFFNPQHGPSVQDVDWAPAGGQLRPVPVCAADAERVECGAEPAVRKVRDADGVSRRAYWEAGPAYAPYNQGYFNSYAGSGLLPGVLLGAMMFNGFGMGWDGGAADAGAGDMGAGDGGFGEGGFGDAGGDMGGDFDGFGDLGDIF